MSHQSFSSRWDGDGLDRVLLRIVDRIDAMLAYWDCQQVCVFANNAYRDWFGKTREEMHGITLEQLLGPLYQLNLPFFLAALAGETQVFERDIPLPSGRVRHSIATYTPDLVDGLVCGVIVHVADVTPVKELALALQEARAQEVYRAGELRFAGIVNAAMDAVVSVDSDQRVIVFNPAAEQLFGCPAADALSQPLDRFIPVAQRPMHAASLAAFQHTSVTSRAMNHHRHVLGLRADGGTVPLEASISQVTVEGRTICTAILRDISERLASEAALRAARDDLERRVAERTHELTEANELLAAHTRSLAVSEARYRTLVQNLPDISVLMFDQDLRYLLVEGNGMGRHGYDPAMIVGRTLEEVVPNERAAVLRHAYRTALAGQPVRMEHSVGDYTYETRFVPVYDDNNQVVAGMAVVDDITKRSRLEQSLREREQIYATLFQVLPIGVTITDPAGQILDANPASERMLGLSRSTQQQRSFDDAHWRVIRPDGSTMPSEEFASVRALREQRLVADVEMGVIKPAGRITWLSVTATPMPLADYGVVIVFSDITERMLMEQALRSTLAERETLLKEVHHRVKNNLQVVVSLLRLQARTVADPAAVAALRESRQRVEAMALVHEQIYQGSHLATLDAGTYMRHLGQQLTRSYALRPGAVTLEIQAEGVWLSLDQAIPCGLIINELLANSLKYAFPGERSGTIGITLEVTGDMLALTVWDTGEGIAPLPAGGHQPLGLRLVHDLARQLRGSVQISSPPGTSVIITFPANPALAQHVATSSERTSS